MDDDSLTLNDPTANDDVAQFSSSTRQSLPPAARAPAPAPERTPPSHHSSWSRHSQQSLLSQHSHHSQHSQPPLSPTPTLSMSLLSEQSEAPFRWSPSYETPVTSRAHRSQPTRSDCEGVRQLQPERTTGIPLSSPINGHQQSIHLPRHSSGHLRALNDSSTDSPPLHLNDSLLASLSHNSSPGPILTSPSGLPSALPPQLAQSRQITTPRLPLPSPWPSRGVRVPTLVRSFSMSASDADSQSTLYRPTTAPDSASSSTSATRDTHQHHWATKDTPSRMPTRTRSRQQPAAAAAARAISRAQSMPTTLDSPTGARNSSSPLLCADSPLVGRARGGNTSSMSNSSSASLALTLPSNTDSSLSAFTVSTCSTCLNGHATGAQSMCTCELLADSNTSVSSISSLGPAPSASMSMSLKTPTKRSHQATRRRRASPVLSTISGSDTDSGSATEVDDDDAPTPRATQPANASAVQSHRHRSKRSNTSTGDMSPVTVGAPPSVSSAIPSNAAVSDSDTQVVPGKVTQFTLSHFPSISLSSLDSATTGPTDTCSLLLPGDDTLDASAQSLLAVEPAPATAAGPLAEQDLASLLAKTGPTHFQDTMQASVAAVDMATTPNLGFRSARPGYERKPVVSAEMAESARRLLFDKDLERMKKWARRARDHSPIMDAQPRPDDISPVDMCGQTSAQDEKGVAVGLTMASPLMDEFGAMEEAPVVNGDDELAGLNENMTSAQEPVATRPQSPDLLTDMDDIPDGFVPAAQLAAAGFVSARQVPSAPPSPVSKVQNTAQAGLFAELDLAGLAQPDSDKRMAHSPDPFAHIDQDRDTCAQPPETAPTPSATCRPLETSPPPTLAVVPGQFTPAVSFVRPAATTAAGLASKDKGKGKGRYRLSAISAKPPAAARDPEYLAKLQAELLGITGTGEGEREAPLGMVGGGFGTVTGAFGSAAMATTGAVATGAAAEHDSAVVVTTDGFAPVARPGHPGPETVSNTGLGSAPTDAVVQRESMPFVARARGAVLNKSETAPTVAKVWFQSDGDVNQAAAALLNSDRAENAPPLKPTQQEPNGSLFKTDIQLQPAVAQPDAELATPRRLGSVARISGGGSLPSTLPAPPLGAKRSGFVTPFKSKTPASTTKSTPASEFATPAQPASMAPPVAPMATPSTVGQMRRSLPSISSLAMTPLMTPQSLPSSLMSATRPAVQQPFKTPFKTPRPPASSAVPTPLAGGRRVTPQPQPKSTVATPSAAANRASRSVPSVFDLTWQPTVVGKPRRQLHELGPPGLAMVASSESDALHASISSSVAAATFTFPSLGATDWGPADAYAELVQAGAVPHLISHRWVRNHYRWIVWKLAGYARAYGGGHANSGVMLPKLTRDTVIRQLRYRYEREIVQGQRSALKQILERDELGYRPAVFCVARVVLASRSADEGESVVARVVLELTDGWYSIQALPDDVLVSAVQRGRIRVGCKLAVSMAPMINNSEGIAAVDATPDWPPVTLHDQTYDPLDPEHTATAPALKLSCNSTKLARWDAKLGFMGGRRTLPVSLRSLTPNGSVFSEVGVQVLRVYPLMHMETFPNGERAYRNEREEAEAQRKYDTMMRQQRVVRDARKLIRAEQVSDEQLAQVIVLGQWEDLRAEVPNAGVAADLEARARKVSERELQAARSKVQRNVTPFFRVLVACARQVHEVRDDEWVGSGGDEMEQENAQVQAEPTRSAACAERALITVWRPDESARMEVQEGQFFRILNGSVMAKIKGRLRITANRRTAWISYSPTKPEGPGGRMPTEYVPRTTVAEYKCLISPALENEARLASPDTAIDVPKLSTEVDITGVILDVRRLPNSGTGMDLHLMDTTGRGFVVVKLYERMWIPAFHDSLVPGVCVELRNIKIRRMDSRFYVPYLESTEETEIVRVRGMGVLSQERVERGRLAMADPMGRGQMQLGQREMHGVNIGEFFSQSP